MKLALRFGPATAVVASILNMVACGSDSTPRGFSATSSTTGSGGNGSTGSNSGSTSAGSSSSSGGSSSSGSNSGSSSGGGSSGGGGSSSSGSSSSGGSTSSSAGSSTSSDSNASSGEQDSSVGDSGGTAVTHTMADCDTLAASDSELVLPATKTKVTKPALPATPTNSACILAAAIHGPNESQTTADTARIKAALANSSCTVVKLVTSGSNDSFISGALDVIGPKVLWIDSGVTLYASVNSDLFAYSGRTSCGAQSYDEDCESTGGTQCTALINMTGQGPQLVGGGTLDGQGGKPIIVGGTQQTYSWWDLSVALREDDLADAGVNPANCGSTPPSQRGGSAPNPQLIIGGAAASGKSDKTTSNLVVSGLTIQNSPKFHIKFASNGFNIWGNTILTPSDKTIAPINARNTDGIDPGEGYLATSGDIVCNMISTGDDDIVLKGHYGVGNVVVAHNHFGSGHGMSIGSETQGQPGLTSSDTAASSNSGIGIQDVDIYDITIDGDTRSNGGAPGSDVNGARVKSDTSRGGIVQNVTYHDICTRDIVNPIIVNPHYSAKTASPALIPYFEGLTIKNLTAVLGSAPDGTVTPLVTLEGYDSTHPTNITLDNVVVQGIEPGNVFSDANTKVTFGPQGANFAVPPSVTTAGNPTGIACDWGWPVPRP